MQSLPQVNRWTHGNRGTRAFRLLRRLPDASDCHDLLRTAASQVPMRRPAHVYWAFRSRAAAVWDALPQPELSIRTPSPVISRAER